ncbi:MAG: general secretion pathway protein GspK [Candidatus Omnitrophica bacterium]|nr:general secretion pathway protein GspK [Candidatus Omnitrophota bacterium]
MNNKGQALMFSLWVLIILTLLSVNLGHEVSLSLRVGRYSTAQLRAYALARAGVGSAVVELNRNHDEYDSLTQLWCSCNDPVTEKTLFLNQEIQEGSKETFTIGDRLAQEGSRCMVDEERKININTASMELLTALLQNAGSPNAKADANSIRAFRGDSDPELLMEIRNCQNHDCIFKKSPFVNTEELVLVKGITQELMKNLKSKVTVFGSGAININTVPIETLNIFLKGIAREISASENSIEALGSKIIKRRETGGPYKTRDDLDIPLDSADETNIFNRLKDEVVFRSDNFLIQATGQSADVKSRIAAVYERKNKKIIFWHEG